MIKDRHAPWRDEETLRQKYCVEGKTLEETAEELGCSFATVGNWLNKYGIETRTGGPGNHSETPWRDKEWLESRYVESEKSSTEMAEEAGCDRTTITNWLRKHGIERRSPGNGYPEDRKWKDKEWLFEQYWSKGKSTREIAAGVECNKKTIHDQLVSMESVEGGPFQTSEPEKTVTKSAKTCTIENNTR